jgi:hypothetical protein
LSVCARLAKNRRELESHFHPFDIANLNLDTLIPSPPNSVGVSALLVWFAVSQDAQLIQAFRLIGSLPAIASVEVFCGFGRANTRVFCR